MPNSFDSAFGKALADAVQKRIDTVQLALETVEGTALTRSQGEMRAYRNMITSVIPEVEEYILKQTS